MVKKKVKKLSTAKRLEQAEARIEELQSEVYVALDDRLDRITDKFNEIEKKLEDIFEGLGGAVWRTQQGHARFIAVLSMGHLKNLLEWTRTPENIRGLVRLEIQRREIDVQFRREEMEKARILNRHTCSPSISRQVALERAREVVRLLGG